ncbi:uncharacterized protein [Penaeus vannamei]|uniref:uncharacterized protein n=1 Tax=Penaeus vannamei TaxID=6689 RepID=UPI00387FAAA5
MYEGARTRVRTSVGTTGWISVRVGLHQGSSLSPYLFDLIMDVLAEGVKEQTPWCMMIADDIFIANTSKEEIGCKLDKWKMALEDRGLKVSKEKIEYLDFCEEEGEMRMQGEVLKRAEKFKYLGSVVSKDAEMESEVTHVVQAGWMNWKKMSGVLCNKKINGSVIGKLYKTTDWPAMIYGAETWPTKKEVKMLKWMRGVTKLDNIRNLKIRGTVKVEKFLKKVQERRLQWYRHIMRRGDYVGRRLCSLVSAARDKAIVQRCNVMAAHVSEWKSVLCLTKYNHVICRIYGL